MVLSYEYKSFLIDKILQYLPAKRWNIGNKINFSCPLCGDGKTGRRHRGWLYLDTASYYCFNCSTGMSGIKFLEAISGQDYAEIKKEYTKLFLKSNLSTNLSSFYEAPQSEPTIFDLKPMVKPEWKQALSAEAKAYLDSRLVSKAPFYQDNLYSWKNSKGNEYILIDWTINGVDAYFQLNDFQKHGNLKYIFPKDSKKLVAGLDNIDMSWPYIIVFEGFYDSVFVKNGICVGTKAITDYQLDLIRQHFPRHQIVISFDNDEAGLQSMKKLIEHNCDFKFFKWFDKNTKQKDINDYIKFKNDVNIFSDKKYLESLIVDKLSMKMYMLKNSLWHDTIKMQKDVISNGTSSSWKTRKIF